MEIVKDFYDSTCLKVAGTPLILLQTETCSNDWKNCWLAAMRVIVRHISEESFRQKLPEWKIF